MLLLSGPFLLGGGLPVEVTVHLSLSPAALLRRTDPALGWTLPAFRRYDDEVGPAEFADVVVRADDPRRPAVVEIDATAGDPVAPGRRRTGDR